MWRSRSGPAAIFVQSRPRHGLEVAHLDGCESRPPDFSIHSARKLVGPAVRRRVPARSLLCVMTYVHSSQTARGYTLATMTYIFVDIDSWRLRRCLAR